MASSQYSLYCVFNALFSLHPISPGPPVPKRYAIPHSLNPSEVLSSFTFLYLSAVVTNRIFWELKIFLIWLVWSLFSRILILVQKCTSDRHDFFFPSRTEVMTAKRCDWNCSRDAGTSLASSVTPGTKKITIT